MASPESFPYISSPEESEFTSLQEVEPFSRGYWYENVVLPGYKTDYKNIWSYSASTGRCASFVLPKAARQIMDGSWEGEKLPAGYRLFSDNFDNGSVIHYNREYLSQDKYGQILIPGTRSIRPDLAVEAFGPDIDIKQSGNLTYQRESWLAIIVPTSNNERRFMTVGAVLYDTTKQPEVLRARRFNFPVHSPPCIGHAVKALYSSPEASSETSSKKIKPTVHYERIIDVYVYSQATELWQEAVYNQ